MTCPDMAPRRQRSSPGARRRGYRAGRPAGAGGAKPGKHPGKRYERRASRPADGPHHSHGTPSRHSRPAARQGSLAAVKSVPVQRRKATQGKQR
jgi:hypothetical protein